MFAPMRAINLTKWAIWGLAAVALVIALWRLEGARAELPGQIVQTEAGPVTLYDGGGPLVVVTHGFAGSVQLMQTISRDLARAGFSVAAFDFLGHGRNSTPMSADVTRIQGTTLQLVAQTEAVVQAIRAFTGKDGPMALVGHSMATDIIIRAHENLPDVSAIVAISMYSDAVSEASPQRLLVISGERENRLRDVGLRALQMVGPGAEGETVSAGTVTRRATFAPSTGHATVLFSPVALAETRAWIGAALDHPPQGMVRSLGWEILMVLGAITVLIFPAARLLPKKQPVDTQLKAGAFLGVLVIPAIVATSAAALLGGSLLGLAGVRYLFVFFAVWGVVALAMLWRKGLGPRDFSPPGAILLILWSLAFALVLDRYGAAFLPTGARIWVMLALLPGCVAFMLADQLVLNRAPVWQWALMRVAPFLALTGMMVLSPGQAGLMFTVVPVLLLFFAVFGTMGWAVGRRVGPETSALVLGLCLAWSIAASTPLFQG